MKQENTRIVDILIRSKLSRSQEESESKLPKNCLKSALSNSF